MDSDINKPTKFPPTAFQVNAWQALKKIIFLLLLSIAVFSINAQTPETVKSRINKGQLSIKPNSRDMNVVIRNNRLQRIDRQRKQVMLKKMQQMRQQKLMQKNINKNRRQEMMQRRKQMIQQRNHLKR